MPNQATHNFTKSWVMIGGTGIRADRWSVSRPAYGVIGGFTAETSSEVLTSANLDLYQLGQQAKGQIPVHIIVESPIYGSVTIFGGELDSVDWDFQTDTIRLAGRDWAGILADTKRVLMGNETIGAPYAATTRSSSVQAQPLGTKTPPWVFPLLQSDHVQVHQRAEPNALAARDVHRGAQWIQDDGQQGRVHHYQRGR
jgi:hypothetical protein